MENLVVNSSQQLITNSPPHTSIIKELYHKFILYHHLIIKEKHMTKVFYPITSKSHFSSSFNLSLSYLVILHFIILYHHRVTMYHKYKLSTMHPSRKNVHCSNCSCTRLDLESAGQEQSRTWWDLS